MAKKRRAARSLRERLQDTFASIDWSVSGRYARFIVSAAVLAGLAIGWVLALPRLEAAVARAAWPSAVDVRFLAVPNWVDDELLGELGGLVRDECPGDPLRQHDLVAAREMLLASGWFDRVDQVRRVAPETIEVDGRFAERAAVVRDGDVDLLVDPRGRLLPRSWPAGAAQGFVVIEGVRTPRPARIGDRWNSPELDAALEVLATIAPTPWCGQIARIDASAQRTDGTLTLRTDNGATIVWGAPPGDEAPLEIDAQEKLAILHRAWRDWGRVDCGYAGTWYFLREGYFSR